MLTHCQRSRLPQGGTGAACRSGFAAWIRGSGNRSYAGLTVTLLRPAALAAYIAASAAAKTCSTDSPCSGYVATPTETLTASSRPITEVLDRLERRAPSLGQFGRGVKVVFVRTSRNSSPPYRHAMSPARDCESSCEPSTRRMRSPVA
jgi:hypothetical protein